MSVIVQTEHGWLLDHQQFMDQQMASSSTEGNGTDFNKYLCKRDLFNICCPFVMDSQFAKQSRSEACWRTENPCPVGCGTHACAESTSSSRSEAEECRADAVESRRKCRNRKRKTELNEGEMAAHAFHVKVRVILEKALDQLLSLGKEKGAFRLKETKNVLDNNKSARKAAAITGAGEKLVSVSDLSTESQPPLSINGAGSTVTESVFNRMVDCGNRSVRRVEIGGSPYLIPARCRFVMSDMSRMRPLVQDGKQYNIIVLDPPWENKSVKRKKKYSSLRNDDFLELPIPELMHERECLVAVWVTNKQQQQKFVLEDLFPCWGIDYVTTWFWLKITQYGETVLPLEGGAKKPYECIVMGRRGTVSVPRDQVLLSVPASVHSWKPPLNDILRPFVKPDANCLELFARNLQTGWTSWGNEVLLHQHVDFYEDCKTPVD